MQDASVSAMPVRTIVSRICWCENELIDESWWHSKQNLFVLYHTEVEELRGSLVANTCLYPMHKRYDTCKQGWYEEVWKPKAYVRTMYLVLFHRSASPISWPQITPIERLTHTLTNAEKFLGPNNGTNYWRWSNWAEIGLFCRLLKAWAIKTLNIVYN